MSEQDQSYEDAFDMDQPAGASDKAGFGIDPRAQDESAMAAAFDEPKQDEVAALDAAVAEEKAALIDALLPLGTLVLFGDDERTRAFKAALTMNISMLELQGQLAVQGTPPTDEQRQAANLKRSRAGHLHNCRVALNRIRDAMAELEARVAAQGEQR